MEKDKVYQICQELKKIIDTNQIYIYEPMKNHTSFKIGGPADIFIKIKSIDELRNVLEIIRKEDIPYFVMGNGSNLLVKDNGIRGIVLKNGIDNIEINKNNDEYIVKVGAGVKLMNLAKKLLMQEARRF